MSKRCVFALTELCHAACLDLRMYPDGEFMALRRALPELKCSWFDDIDNYGSIKAAVKAKLKRLI
jgi:hypothetical protein